MEFCCPMCPHWCFKYHTFHYLAEHPDNLKVTSVSGLGVASCIHCLQPCQFSIVHEDGSFLDGDYQLEDGIITHIFNCCDFY